MTWQIKGIEEFEDLSGRFETKEALALLTVAQERAEDWYRFDQLLSGRVLGGPLLSGSQLLWALQNAS